MATRIIRAQSEDGVRIGISGRFDFSTHREFRATYADDAPGSQPYIVDLSATEYMDSSALGMLLLLRQHAGDDPSRVTLIGAGGVVRRVLEIANFGRLFRIP